jgi:hypothetical protein
MRTRQVAPAVWILALSAVVLFSTWDQGYWSGTTPGPAFLPLWLVAAGVLVTGLSLAEGWRSGRGNGDGDAIAWPDKPALQRALLTFVGLLTIPILSPLLGMVVSGVLFMMFLLLVVLRRPLLPSLLTVAITGGVIQVIFVWWLGLPLPQGLVRL